MKPGLDHDIVHCSVTDRQRSGFRQSMSAFDHDLAILVRRRKTALELCQRDLLEDQNLVLVGDGVDACMETELRSLRLRRGVVVIESVEGPDHVLHHSGIVFLQVDSALLSLFEHAAACLFEKLRVGRNEAAVDLELSAFASDGEVGELFVVVVAMS
jgi:hypothetical protein